MSIQQKTDLDLALGEYIDEVVIVEGKKDAAALAMLGFKRVYTIHETSVPIRERAVNIASQLGKNDKVCILTDFDKKGKQLYFLLKSTLQELGVKIDGSLRAILGKAGISHIEGLYTFIMNQQKS